MINTITRGRTPSSCYFEGAIVGQCLILYLILFKRSFEFLSLEIDEWKLVGKGSLPDDIKCEK